MDDLLKEAIADAKAVRETALENAKMALEEAFTPRLQNMLSKKIQTEMEDEDEMDEIDDESGEEATEERYMNDEDEDPSDEASEEPMGEPEAEMGGGREVSVDDFLAALETALEDVLGDEVEVDQEAEEEELVDLENGDEMELEMGAVEEDPALQEMISTITKRVAKRIVKEALQKKK